MVKKISPINGVLFNGVLIPNPPNNPLASWFLMNVDFFLPPRVQATGLETKTT